MLRRRFFVYIRYPERGTLLSRGDTLAATPFQRFVIDEEHPADMPLSLYACTRSGRTATPLAMGQSLHLPRIPTDASTMMAI